MFRLERRNLLILILSSRELCKATALNSVYEERVKMLKERIDELKETVKEQAGEIKEARNGMRLRNEKTPK